MSKTVSIVPQITIDRQRNYSISRTGDIAIDIDRDILGSAYDDQLIDIKVDVSKVQYLLAYSTYNTLIETNNGTTPTETLQLKANEPYIYVNNGYNSLLFTSDITGGIYVSGENGTDHTFRFQVLTQS